MAAWTQATLLAREGDEHLVAAVGTGAAGSGTGTELLGNGRGGNGRGERTGTELRLKG
jgi:hypothetical protein